METIRFLHSYWAYLVLIILVLATFNALIKFFGKKEFGAQDFRISLFALIVSHIQFLLGIILWFAMDYIGTINEVGMSDVMKTATLRSNIIEHPTTMLVALVLITIGYSKHKKQLTSNGKFKSLAIFYTLGLILVLAKIPWKVWFA